MMLRSLFFKASLFVGFLFALILIQPPFVRAQLQQSNDYARAKVVTIQEEQKVESPDVATGYIQRVLVERQDTKEKIELTVGSEFQPLTETQRLLPGKTVIITQIITADGQAEYVIMDVFRLPVMLWLLIGFMVLVIVVARWQGLLSIVGMALSLMILSGIMVPQILNGANPLVVSIVGSAIIATCTIYLSHGFRLESHLALAAMIGTLAVVTVLSAGAVRAAQLVGLGSEEAYFLQFGQTARINLQGLLLGGIVLGALGILDDITVAQVSTVKQLLGANPKMGVTELYERGLAVGKDHVASLVNTLVLAYAGANLPLFILFTLNKNTPWWVTINNELIAEEVVRTLVGSMGLVLAVPLSTLLAATILQRAVEKKLVKVSAQTRSVAHGHHSH